jgi:hypothetical protein
VKDNPEFQIYDYDKEVQIIADRIERCKKIINSNEIQAIPSFNEIILREFEAVLDTLRIGHFHASARCARAALELTAANLCLYHHVSGDGRLIDMSFSKKYRVYGLTHKKNSPILQLIKLGILDDFIFRAFCEEYSELSSYVHYRETYHLIHIMPELIGSEHNYSEVLRLSGNNDEIGRIVKATMIHKTLGTAFEVLEMLLVNYNGINKTEANAGH